MTTTNDEAASSARAGATSKVTGHGTCRQVPPVHTGEAVNLGFMVGNAGLIQMVATGTDPNLGTSYKQNTEYWFATAMSLASVQYIKMPFASGAFTAAEINQIFSGYSQAFSDPEIVAQSDWLPGQVPVPQGVSARLYRAPDPDSPSNYIGLLIEQNGSNDVVGVAWYKTWQPQGGWVWQPGNSPLDGLTWELVTDSKGNPSTDPDNIEPGKSWYYFVQS